MNVLKRIRKYIILGVVNTIFRGTHFFTIKRYLLNMCPGVQLGYNVKIVTPIYIPALSGMYIQENTWIGRNFSIEGNGEVLIGGNCDLGPSVTCITGSHKIGDTNRRAGEGYNSNISIGRGCWIGAKASLLPGISVAEGCVIGAATNVTRDTEPNGVYVGNPAMKVRDLEGE